jgi:hypothetical protein
MVMKALKKVKSERASESGDSDSWSKDATAPHVSDEKGLKKEKIIWL